MSVTIDRKTEFETTTKLYRLLQIALEDMKEAQKNCNIHMGYWHLGIDPNSGRTKCSVCLAGAVMRETLKVEDTECYGPSEFPVEIEKRLLAIDALRAGNVNLARIHIGLRQPQGSFTQPCPYRLDPETWWVDIKQLQAQLKELDL